MLGRTSLPLFSPLLFTIVYCQILLQSFLQLTKKKNNSLKYCASPDLGVCGFIFTIFCCQSPQPDQPPTNDLSESESEDLEDDGEPAAKSLKLDSLDSSTRGRQLQSFTTVLFSLGMFWPLRRRERKRLLPFWKGSRTEMCLSGPRLKTCRSWCHVCVWMGHSAFNNQRTYLVCPRYWTCRSVVQAVQKHLLHVIINLFIQSYQTAFGVHCVEYRTLSVIDSFQQPTYAPGLSRYWTHWRLVQAVQKHLLKLLYLINIKLIQSWYQSAFGVYCVE